jgi:chaperonin GroES
MEVTKIRPLYDRLLVKRKEAFEAKTIGGIYIPDSAQEKGQFAEVLAVGKGRLNTDGSFGALMVKEGDTVLIGKYSGTDAGNDMLIVREDEVLGIVEK